MLSYEKSIRHVILCNRMKQQLIRSAILSRERITEAKPYPKIQSENKNQETL